MKKIIILVVIGFFFAPIYSQAQTQDKFHVFVKMSSNQSLADQKNNIEFFREFFGTNECTFDTPSNSYKILTIHNYDIDELITKIEGNSSFKNLNITITKSENPTNISEQ